MFHLQPRSLISNHGVEFLFAFLKMFLPCFIKTLQIEKKVALADRAFILIFVKFICF